MPKYKFDKLVNHESIHTHQIKELGYIFFYILYLLEFLIKLPIFLFNADVAYKSISFEQEAYKYENDFTYLQNRKPYAWLKYIFKYA